MVSKKGFTLIEILVVIGILAIIVVIGSTSFISLLRGSAKTRVLTEVKQNGNYALGVMEGMIRNARVIEENSDGQTCSSGMTKIKIKNPDGGETEFACLEDGSVSSGSGTPLVYERLTNTKVEVETCAFDCQVGGPLQPDVVTISFGLKQTQETIRPEEQALINFKTAVILRNITD